MSDTKVKFETGFLFTKCSFLRGIGSVLNLPGNYYTFNTSKTATEADFKAIYSDWENVGADIKTAKKKFEEENSKLLKECAL